MLLPPRGAAGARGSRRAPGPGPGPGPARVAAAPAAGQATAAAQPPTSPHAARRPGRPPDRPPPPQAPGTRPPARVRSTARLAACGPRRPQGRAVPAGGLAGQGGPPAARPRARPGPWPRRAPRRGQAARCWPDTGPSAGRGPQRPEGRPGPYAHRPAPSRLATTVAGARAPRRSPAPRLQKAGAPPRPVVRRVQPSRRPQAHAPMRRGRRARPRAATLRVDAARVRCPIAWHCREAQPSWGRAAGRHLPPQAGPRPRLCRW